MRLILALFLMLPLVAQQPPAEAKPAAPAEQTPAEAKPAAEEKAAAPAPSTESWINGYVDIGYRWVTDVGGNVQQYRSVVNLGEGPKVLGVDLTLQGTKLFDTVTLRGVGWGGDPYNTALMNARKAKLYDLRVDYRNIAYFNAVPSFANPGGPDGFAPGGFNERSFDINRRATTYEIDLFPGTRIIPFLAYERDTAAGRGVQTWVMGSTNEFPIPYTVRNRTDRYRGGVRMELNRFHMTVEQGGTRYKEDDNTYWTGSNPGDRTTPVNGQLTRLTSLNQAYGIRGTGVFTRGLLTARPVDWLNVHGQFLYSQPKTTTQYQEIATGNLYQASTGSFFPGVYALSFGNAIQPHTSGNGGVEATFGRVRILESLTLDRFHDDGYGMYTPQVFQNFATAGATSLNPRQRVSYKQIQTDVIVDVFKGLKIRGGHRYVRGDVTVRAGNLSQIGPEEVSELHRTVGIFGFTYRPWQKLSFNGDYEASSSDRVYFRTSLNEYHRARATAKLQATSSLTFQAKFRLLDNKNPAQDINFDYQSRDNAFSVFWTPNGGKRVTVMGEYNRATIDSSIRYLDLPFFTPASSVYHDVAHLATSAVDIVLPGARGGKLTAGGSLFITRGSRPTRYYQPLAKLTIPLHKSVLWNTEWQYYGFGEQFYYFEAFRAHTFTTGVRLTR